MRGYIAFVKKEVIESIRTYKVLILLCIFFFFGMSSPLLAKLLPEVLSGMEIEGMVIKVPEPSAVDAYAQFFKNVTQMGTIVILLVFSGVLSHELVKGTLINVLTKGLSRTSVITAKFTSVGVLWTIAFWLSALTNFGYTEYLFPNGNAEYVFFACFCFWLFGLLLIALLLLGSTLISNNYGGMIFVAGIIFVMLLVNMIPSVTKYCPITLASVNMNLINQTMAIKDVLITVYITIGGILITLFATIALFRKKVL